MTTMFYFISLILIHISNYPLGNNIYDVRVTHMPRYYACNLIFNTEARLYYPES